MSFHIDNYHELSSYYVGENGTSIMNNSLKRMLSHPEKIDNIFEPYDLKLSFMKIFEVELHERIQTNLFDIYRFLNLSEKKDYSSILCSGISGPFHSILGIDKYNYGWNKIGLFFQKESLKKEKGFFFPVFELLIHFFYKNYHFQPFYGKTFQEVSKLINNMCIEKYIIIKEYELEEIYEYEMSYPGSFLYIIQKLWGGKIRVWEHHKILKEVKKIVYRSINIPAINDLKCNNNLLYLYFEGKLPLPRGIRDTLQHYENIRLTDSEIDSYQNFMPFHKIEKSSLLLSKNHPLHPEYRRSFFYRGYKMTSILQCLHFQLLLPFSSKEKAYRDSFQLTSTLWDETLTDFFKKNFYLELNKKLVTLPFRIALLETGNLKIKNNDMIEPITGYKDNFLGRLLENARKEMYDYLLPENGILQEIILFFLQRWISLWYEIKEEKEIIDFFFEFWFPCIKKKTCYETEIIYPLSLKNLDNHDYIYSYLSNHLVLEKEIHLPGMMIIWKKYLNEKSIFYFFENINNFRLFTKDIQIYFEFPSENIDFKDQEELTLFLYLSFDYFLFKK